jgi:16S rRNA (guanine966-N2)-methyltransferase
MRVIAGTLGGRRLVAPAGEATRPTTDRVREALFSILNGRGALEGARVVDLYAGTGALGIEALSRGAVHATFVESARPALASLRQNLEALGIADRSEVVTARVERWTRPAGAPPFDLVLADPPWADIVAARDAIAALVAKGHVAPGGLVVVERAGPPTDVARARRATAVWMGRAP